jgi:LysR family glycine cleavage system transcriptional activator
MNTLQSFVAVARAENLTRAADALHLTVSALSHQMRALENRVGYPLFVRASRGLVLTAEGRRLLDTLGPHIDAIENALRPLYGRRDTTLSLSALPSVSSSWLLPRMPRFLAANPEIELNLDSSIERVDFAGGRFDAALRYGPGQWPGVIAEPLFEEWLTPVASPDLLAGRAPPQLATLGDWPLLCPDDPWPQWFATFGGAPPARYAATFSDSETLQRAAVEGMGVALGRATMIRPLIEAGRLVAFFPQRLRARFAHYLVYPARSRGHAGFGIFREWLHEEARLYRDVTATTSATPLPVTRPESADRADSVRAARRTRRRAGAGA